MASSSRPLSPHLQIYHWAITMATSILQRATGIAMYVGTLLVVLWLGTAAFVPQAHGAVQALFGHWFGQLVLFGYTWALLFHMMGGLRHFIWDMGYGFSREARFWISRINAYGSVVLALAAWAVLVWF